MGVAADNPFVFANTELSKDHVLGWDTVKYMCCLAEVDSPQLNATNNRGRISTLYAALDIPPEARPLFYAHMGHTADVNIGTYQRPLPIQEIVKVGTHLQAFDQGRSAAHINANASVSVSKIDCVISPLDSVQRTNAMMCNAMMLRPLLHRILRNCSVNFLQMLHRHSLAQYHQVFISLFGLNHFEGLKAYRSAAAGSVHMV